jgi:hypothetical protein
MKNLYLLFFITIINQAYAQKYKPLVEEGKYWIYEYLHQPESSSCFFFFTEKGEVHHFGKDTIVDNIPYKEILNSTLQLTGPMGSLKFPFEIKQTNVMGYIREDTFARKVYVLPNELMNAPCTESFKEYLLFDFSLEKEDSINECLAYYIYQLRDQYEYPKIDSIKYELDFYGKSRSHFYSFGYFDLCKFWHVPGYIIEGFGFKDGPFRGQLNRRLVNYCEGTLEQCNIISSTKDDQFSRANKIVILPNPAFDYISFRLNENIVNATNGYCIRNITGNMLEKESLIDFGTNYIIHTHDFPSGMYILQLLKDDQIVQTEKFIILH